MQSRSGPQSLGLTSRPRPGCLDGDLALCPRPAMLWMCILGPAHRPLDWLPQVLSKFALNVTSHVCSDTLRCRLPGCVRRGQRRLRWKLTASDSTQDGCFPPQWRKLVSDGRLDPAAMFQLRNISPAPGTPSVELHFVFAAAVKEASRKRRAGTPTTQEPSRARCAG